jgi:excisionase family DNA binding protein
MESSMRHGFTDDEIAQARVIGLRPYKRYTIAEATAYLQVDEATVLRLCETAELGSLKIGRKRFVLGGHIARWKAGQSAQPKLVVAEPADVTLATA